MRYTIKKLEWNFEEVEEGIATCDTILGDYWVEKCFAEDSFCGGCRYGDFEMMEYFDNIPTMEEAIAVCEKHYYETLKSVLEECD